MATPSTSDAFLETEGLLQHGFFRLMAIFVLELELKGRQGDLCVPAGYAGARLLLRWNGRPVGQLNVPVEDGRIRTSTLEQALSRWAGRDFWFAWLHDSLDWDESESSTGPPRATIAVCTRNRSAELRRCLDAIFALPDLGQDVLVVDNNSSDDTAAVVAAYPRARYLLQREGGLDAARNRAMREARGEIVAFTDDDAFVDAGWLRAILRNFEDPLVLCATGLTLPIELETQAQEWFELYCPFERGFQRRVFDWVEWNPMVAGPIGVGANVAFRRDTIDLVGEFDEALDGGTLTKSAGDHEMFTRILAAGYRIVYDPAALSWHKHRRTIGELRSTLRGYGTGAYAMWTRAVLNGEATVFKHAYAWLRHVHIPEILRSLTPRRRRIPLTLVLAELRGCVSGPRAYLRSRAAVKKARPPVRSATGWTTGSAVPRTQGDRTAVLAGGENGE